jgi:hypothetical protein
MRLRLGIVAATMTASRRYVRGGATGTGIAAKGILLCLGTCSLPVVLRHVITPTPCWAQDILLLVLESRLCSQGRRLHHFLSVLRSAGL